MSDYAMYILVNKDIEMSPGKLAGQVAHAAVDYLLLNRRVYTGNDFLYWKETPEKTKIILYAKSSLLEELEKANYVTVRDLGKTELEPNTLTCVCAGVYKKDTRPKFIKRLRLVS